MGKTECSILLAERLKGEIVSADSRQVYRYMNIGTAKPTEDDLRRAAHHFIDIRDPDQYYSAGEYGREARDCIDRLLSEGVRPVVVGGSGFYIRALVDGLFAPDVSDRRIKEKWRRRIEEEGIDAVFSYLRSVDPRTAERLHPNDTQRVVRALEVWDLAGLRLSDFHEHAAVPASFTPVFIGLTRPREALHERINRRVDRMMQQGLVDEVKSLLEKGWGPELNALRTVGYQEVFDYLKGAYDSDEMIRLIKQNSRRYAKRQSTWFRKDSRVTWIDVDLTNPHEVMTQIINLTK